MNKKLFLMISTFILVISLSGCNNDYENSYKKMDYTISECKYEEFFEENPTITLNQSAFLEQTIKTKCCETIEMTYRINHEVLRIYEDPIRLEGCESEEEDCECSKKVRAEIREKEKYSEIEIYNKERTDYPYEFIFEYAKE